MLRDAPRVGVRRHGDRATPTGDSDCRHVVFVDLDLTLFDSTRARECGALAALQTLFQGDGSADEVLELYSAVVERWQVFRLLGFPNLRHVWNVPELYLLVAALQKGSFGQCGRSFLGELDRLAATLNDREDWPEARSRSVEAIRSSRVGRDLRRVLAELRTDLRLAGKIRRAVEAFDRAMQAITPFPGAEDLLSSLKSSPDVELFILSEGSSLVQWRKLENLGLSGVVDQGRFLTTEAFAFPPVHLLEIDEAIRERLMNSAMPRGVENRGALPEGDRKQATEAALDFTVAALRFFRSLFRRFDSKKAGHFFCAAVHFAAIAPSPEERDYVRLACNGAIHWNDLDPFKLAIVGDRYSYDILPALRAQGLERVITIWRRYGKYQSEDPAQFGSPAPDHQLDDLAEVANVLLDPTIWESKQPVRRPPVIGERITEHNIAYVLSGLQSGLPSIVSLLARAVLADNAVQASLVDGARQAAIEHLHEWRDYGPARTLVHDVLSAVRPWPNSVFDSRENHYGTLA